MIYTSRRWRITDVAAVEDLADKLTQHSWVMCTGFRHAGLLFLNDSLPDSDQEYAVVREADSVQIDSWTCSWMSQPTCARMIRNLLAARLVTGIERPVVVNDHPPGDCSSCA
jgi:hypothetical protein